MNSKGYLLIEVLLAAMLLAVAGVGLYSGLSQGIKAERIIRQSDAAYDPLRIFWMRFEKDLRNSIALRGERYSGKEDEMTFPVLVNEIDNGEKHFGLRRLHYFMKNGTLIRSEQEISNQLVPKDPIERVVLKNIRSLKFKYSYLDEKEKLKFESFWLETPYFGIPKGVQVDAELKEASRVFSKLVSIPQGRWGHVSEGSSFHE